MGAGRLDFEGVRRLLNKEQDGVYEIIKLARHLDESDQALICAIFQGGVTSHRFARAAKAPPATLKSRVQRLMMRMNSRPFTFVLRYRRAWPAAERAAAEMLFLHGRGIRDAAAKTGLSFHHVRQLRHRIIAQASDPESPAQ